MKVMWWQNKICRHVSVSAMPSWLNFCVFLPLAQKTWKPIPIYPLIIADYKEHLRDASIPHLSFHFFCRHYKVKIKSVRQWMHCHGLDVTTMRYDALFEECNHSPETALAQSSSSMVFLCRTRRTPSGSYVLQLENHPARYISGRL